MKNSIFNFIPALVVPFDSVECPRKNPACPQERTKVPLLPLPNRSGIRFPKMWGPCGVHRAFPYWSIHPILSPLVETFVNPADLALFATP
jgi:hypothetical protein